MIDDITKLESLHLINMFDLVSILGYCLRLCLRTTEVALPQAW